MGKCKDAVRATMVSALGTECKHQCMDRMVQQTGGLNKALEFMTLMRDKYHTMNAHSGETEEGLQKDSGGQWVLDRIRNGWRPISEFPHQLEFFVGKALDGGERSKGRCVTIWRHGGWGEGGWQGHVKVIVRVAIWAKCWEHCP